jgi:phospholipid/cholesterol/gamma-HCH transport system substrate-binding protein
VSIELQSRYAPLPSDARAILRQKTLLGETYVELTPGTPSARKLPDGGRLAATQVSPTVELDEIFRSFDERTRRAFQVWMQSQAQAIQGRGRDLNDAFGNLGPFADDASQLVDILNRQQGAVQRLIRDSGEVFAALSERDGQLRQLIENSNTVFSTTAARDEELKQTFVALPTFQRESRTTLTRLTAFADNTDPLVTQLRPAARELGPTLQDLGGLAPDLKALFGDLDPLIRSGRTGIPAAQRILEDARPLIAQIDPAGRQLVPITDFLGLYKREITAFFANTVAATQARDISTRVHYLRTTNPLNLENLAAYPRRPGTNRTNPYMLPGGYDKLAQGLDSFETRHCGRPLPTISPTPPAGGLPPLSSLLPPIPGVPPPPAPTPVPTPIDPGSVFQLPQALLDSIAKFAFPNGSTGVAPACRQQAGQGDDKTLYPHVKAR